MQSSLNVPMILQTAMAKETTTDLAVPTHSKIEQSLINVVALCRLTVCRTGEQRILPLKHY
jgi:mannose/fructose-specific phosphotransferase system component IIA